MDNMEDILNENIVNNNGDTIYDDMGLLDVHLDGKNEKESSDFGLLEENSYLGDSYPVYSFKFDDNSNLMVYDVQNETIVEQLENLNNNILLLDSSLKIVIVIFLFFLFLYCFRWVHMRFRR